MFRPPSGSEKFRRFQNNLLLAEILNLPTERALVRYKAINQALAPFERIGGVFFLFIPEFLFYDGIQEGFAQQTCIML